MPRFGDASKFAFFIGPTDSTQPTTGLREVNVYAADHLLTCKDNNAYLPQFTPCLVRVIRSILMASPRFISPYPDLSPVDNHRRLWTDARNGNNRACLYHRFMDWGPTSDNVLAHLFIRDGIASIPFSFLQPNNLEHSEAGPVFVAELPERALLRVLHEAAWELALPGIK